MTNDVTKGIYSFWPQAIKIRSKSKKSKVKITIEHDKYKPFNIEKEIKTEGVFRVYNYIHGGSIIDLETSYLTHKKN